MQSFSPQFYVGQSPARPGGGESPAEEAETMRPYLRFGAFTPGEMTVLYAELFLSAALGKIPTAAVHELKSALANIRLRFPAGATNAGPHRAVRYSMLDEMLELLAWSE